MVFTISTAPSPKLVTDFHLRYDAYTFRLECFNLNCIKFLRILNHLSRDTFVYRYLKVINFVESCMNQLGENCSSHTLRVLLPHLLWRKVAPTFWVVEMSPHSLPLLPLLRRKEGLPLPLSFTDRPVLFLTPSRKSEERSHPARPGKKPLTVFTHSKRQYWSAGNL